MKKNGLAIALIALLFLGSSCRPQQSAYRQRYETARQREMLHVQQPTTTARGVTLYPVVDVSVRHAVTTEATVQQTPVDVSVRHSAPEWVAQQTPIAVSVRQERVDAFLPANVPAFLPTDAPALRRYSVVVASFSNRWNAETLQTRLQNDGHHVILAQNEHGMFRVIVGSFDDRASAAAQREALRRQYATMGSPDFLRRTYGIPFNDLWILARGF